MSTLKTMPDLSSYSEVQNIVNSRTIQPTFPEDQKIT
jgi:hypothetical protein